MKNEAILAGVAGLIVVIGIFWLTRSGVAAKAGYAVGGAAVDAGLGVVGGINDALGIPRTQTVINGITGVADSIGGGIYNLFAPANLQTP